MTEMAVITPFGFSFEVVRFLSAWRALGCTRAQFYRNEQKPPTVAEALAAAAKAGIRFDSMHGVFGEHIDPSSPDADHRAKCLTTYEAEGKLASDLGGPMVVVHPSCWNPGRKEMTPEQIEVTSGPRWPLLDDFLRRLAEIGERLGVVYLIENQPLNCPLGHDVARLAQAVRSINSPAIRMCLDTGHAHITGNLADSVRVAADVIAYLHIHDNDKKLDDHRMPGDGNIDWPAFADAVRQTGLTAPRMFEVFYDEARIEAAAAAGMGPKLAAWCAMPGR
jgi:hydroxypyruvate isomerase